MNQIDFVKTDCEDYAMHTGVDFIVNMQVTQYCNNLPNDLTGYTGVIRVFDKIETAIVTTISGVVTDALNGVIMFRKTAAETNTLTVGSYSHQIELTSSGGVVYRISEGSFDIEQ
jgi:hypothetical protein